MLAIMRQAHEINVFMWGDDRSFLPSSPTIELVKLSGETGASYLRVNQSQ